MSAKETEVWTDHVGLYHASVRLTQSEDAMMDAVLMAMRLDMRSRRISEGYIMHRLDNVKRTHVTNHGTAIYSEVLT